MGSLTQCCTYLHPLEERFGDERRAKEADEIIAPTTSQASRSGVLLARGRWLLLRLEAVSLVFYFVGCLFCCLGEGWASADVFCPLDYLPTTKPFLIALSAILAGGDGWISLDVLYPFTI